MWVIKIGGSLGDAPVLRHWLDTIAQRGRGKAVIVPGGGAFAELVRETQSYWQFDDITAHRMAILAMQQMAQLFHGLNSELHIAADRMEIYALLRQRKVALWSPNYKLLDRAGIASSWDVTSDSLSAWLADDLQATALMLVKSAPVIGVADWSALSQQGIVDPSFAGFGTRLRCPIKLFNRNEIEVFTDYLAQRGLAGLQ
ncbi:MAG: amino acid kinase family protein [Gammaproteobacteria bacterium]